MCYCGSHKMYNNLEVKNHVYTLSPEDGRAARFERKGVPVFTFEST